MSNRPDWSQWILQKNNEAKQEELRKSDSVCKKCNKAKCKCLKKSKDMAGDKVDSSMLMSELESLEHHIKEIREHIDQAEIAPDWVKAKVSKAASGLSDIAHYIMGLKEIKKGESAELEKALEGARNPKRGDPMFEPTHLRECATLSHEDAKKRAHQVVNGANARPITKNRARLMIDRSKNVPHLLQGMTNYMLAHPSENLKVGRGVGPSLPDERDGGSEAA